MQPSQPKLILVPTDFSEPAAHALRYASALGERFGAHLLIVYADPFLLPVDVPSRGTAEMIEEAREELQKHAEENVSTHVPFDTRVLVSGPVDAILEQARDTGCDLIVMGTHGRTGLRRLLVGSVTEAVMRTAAVPVIAVNASTPETAAVRKILCPVTFTAVSREALRYAAALGESPDTPLVLFHATEAQDLQNTIRELIRLQDWAPTDLAGRCDVKIVPRHASAEDIVAFARMTTADLIAVGIPPGRGPADVLRGTIAERIVQTSGCPVLVVNANTVARSRVAEIAAVTAP